MNNIIQSNWGKTRKLVFSLFCLALYTGAFVPLLVNFIIKGRFTWSIIVLAAVLMAWLITAPWFFFRRQRTIFSWLAAVVCVPAFLFVVESLTANRGWFLSLGLPAALTGLAISGAIIWVWIYSKLKVWYAASLTFILVALLDFLENWISRPFVYPDPFEAIRFLIIFCFAGAALLLGLIALFVHQFKPFQHGK